MVKLLALVVPLLVGVSACGRAEGAVRSRTGTDHGVQVGATVPRIQMHCRDQSTRTVGAPGALQVLTFATPFDCTECTPHVALGPGLVKEAGLEDHAFMVVWSPNSQALRNPSLDQVELPLCVDTRGAIWDALNLQHTPFTAVVRNGTVIYLHDGNFATERERKQFKTDLRTLSRR